MVQKLVNIPIAMVDEAYNLVTYEYDRAIRLVPVIDGSWQVTDEYRVSGPAEIVLAFMNDVQELHEVDAKLAVANQQRNVAAHVGLEQFLANTW